MAQSPVELESAYRPCACRSTTPFFSERVEGVKPSGHGKYRTRFQHDRDKILYCPHFRRLRLKTQIFPEQTADHLRTRLDHTLEVSQIGRHLARQLSLNEDLVDAIALAHDVGHAPFAHSGERALHAWLVKAGHEGFKHNWQGLRVVDRISRAYPEHRGLDLTRAVRIGIVMHTGTHYKSSSRVEQGSEERCKCGMGENLDFDYRSPAVKAFEIQLVALADEFAQAIHDLEDAVVSDCVTVQAVREESQDIPLISECAKWVTDTYGARAISEKGVFLSRLRSRLLYLLTADVAESSREGLVKFEQQIGITSGTSRQEGERLFNDFVAGGGEFPPLVQLTGLRGDFRNLLEYLEKVVVRSERVNRMDGKADYMIRRILKLYTSQPLQVHDSVFASVAEMRRGANDYRKASARELTELAESPEFVRAVVDYVAGMSDRFLLREYDQLFSAYPRVEM